MRDCRKNAVEKEEFGAKKNLPGRGTETFVKLGKTTKANFRVVVIGIFGFTTYCHGHGMSNRLVGKNARREGKNSSRLGWLSEVTSLVNGDN